MLALAMPSRPHAPRSDAPRSTLSPRRSADCGAVPVGGVEEDKFGRGGAALDQGRGPSPEQGKQLVVTDDLECPFSGRGPYLRDGGSGRSRLGRAAGPCGHKHPRIQRPGMDHERITGAGLRGVWRGQEPGCDGQDQQHARRCQEAPIAPAPVSSALDLFEGQAEQVCAKGRGRGVGQHVVEEFVLGGISVHVRVVRGSFL